MGERYSLATGDAGRSRLEILNEAMWPSSLRLLREAGLREGMSFLDVGCGAGALSARVAELGVEVWGIDGNEGFVEAARAQHPGLRFETLDAYLLESLGHEFDFVYARYLLSHLAEPMRALSAMRAVTRPGGCIVLEDIDFDLHVAEPRPPAFDRYLEWYTEVVRRRGGDPFLGRRLFSLMSQAGLKKVRAGVQVSVFTEGETKRISSLTLLGIREALVTEGIADAVAIDEVLDELEASESDPGSLISVAGTHQVWGRVG